MTNTTNSGAQCIIMQGPLPWNKCRNWFREVRPFHIVGVTVARQNVAATDAYALSGGTSISP